MTTITCDLCKKPVHNAEREVNYFTVRNKDLCRECKKKFDRKMEDSLEEGKTYSLRYLNKSYWSELQKATK